MNLKKEGKKKNPTGEGKKKRGGNIRDSGKENKLMPNSLPFGEVRVKADWLASKKKKAGKVVQEIRCSNLSC